MFLYIIQGNPTHAGLQLSPPGGTFPVSFLHNGEDANTREVASPFIVGSGAFADVEIRDFTSISYVDHHLSEIIMSIPRCRVSASIAPVA